MVATFDAPSRVIWAVSAIGDVLTDRPVTKTFGRSMNYVRMTAEGDADILEKMYRLKQTIADLEAGGASSATLAPLISMLQAQEEELSRSSDDEDPPARSAAMSAALEEATSDAAARAADVRATALYAKAKERATFTKTNDVAPEIVAELAECAVRIDSARARKQQARSAQAVAACSGEERTANLCEYDGLIAMRDERIAREDEISLMTKQIDAMEMPVNSLRNALEGARLRYEDASRRGDGEATRLSEEVRGLRSRLSVAEADVAVIERARAQRLEALEATNRGEDEDDEKRRVAMEDVATIRADAAEARKSPEQRAREAAQADEQMTQRDFIAASFAAPAAAEIEAQRPPLSSLSAAELRAALARAIEREDFFEAADLQSELKSDARQAELLADADTTRWAAAAEEEAAALRRATDAGVAFLLRPRDGSGASVEEEGVAVEEEDDGTEDPDAFERWA